MAPLGIGEYPAQFNPRVHGPYNPGRWYGAPDTAFRDVKLGELGSWVARRSFTPVDMVRAGSRGYWQWVQKYLNVKRPGMAPYMHVIGGVCLFFGAGVYTHSRNARHYKYH